MHYQASLRLRAFIRARAPARVTTPDAPPTYSALRAFRDAHPWAALPVFNGGSETSIYGDAATNAAFRAWHDNTHLALWADFGPMGERRVAEAHQRAAISAGLSRTDVSALWADTWGQYAYFRKHHEYVTDQARFVAACLVDGVAETVEHGGKF